MPDHSTNHLPMGQTAADTPKIKVIFRGLVITRIKHSVPGMNPPEDPEAMIGALDPDATNSDDAACHRPIVHFYRISPGGVTTEIRNTFEIGEDFSLRVTGSATRIEVFQKDENPFNRRNEANNDKKDFRWFVDFNEIHERDPQTNPVKIDEPKLKPKFKLNRGVFHTSSLSDGEVNIVRRDGRPPAPFGKFAMEITARIVLAPGEEAVFQNGGWSQTIPADSSDADRYEIVFDCTCRSANENVSDLGEIYEVIINQNGRSIPDKQRVGLEAATVLLLPSEETTELKTALGRPAILLTPEVYCTGGNTFP